jgi:hypothetical protein
VVKNPLENRIAACKPPPTGFLREIKAAAGIPVSARERRIMKGRGHGTTVRQQVGSLQSREHPGYFRQADGVEAGTDRIAFAAGIDEEFVLGL